MRPNGKSKQEIEPRWVLIPNSDGPGEDAIQFLPRFLLREIIFAHCPLDDLYPNQPRLLGIFCPGRSGFVCEAMRDPADSRNRRLSPVQRVRTSQLRKAPRGAPVLAGTGARERMQLVARTDAAGVEVQAEPTALALGEQTESTTQNQTSGSGTWIWLETTALMSLKLRYMYHSSHGPYSKTSSLLVHPSVEIPSPNPTDSLSGCRKHRTRHRDDPGPTADRRMPVNVSRL